MEKEIVNIIGQKYNLKTINKWIEVGCPGFICISGCRGGGKKLLAEYIANKLGITCSITGIGVDDVREAIQSSIHYGGFYVFPDADNMSSNAKNALLKVTEEPPKNSYFVLTVQDEGSLLDTLKSRAQMLRLEPYTQEELMEYKLCMWADFAHTPHDIDILESYGSEFIEYVNLVIDNIREVEPANAFKSAGRLALKDEEDKYDLGLFFSAVTRVCLQRIKENPKKCRHLADIMLVTCKYTTQVSRLGVNKQQLYDSWVFDVRAIE